MSGFSESILKSKASTPYFFVLDLTLIIWVVTTVYKQETIQTHMLPRP
jgi:hypothetical protein